MFMRKAIFILVALSLIGSKAFADDECTQFLNAAFVDDPTIPFPDYGLSFYS